MMNTRKNLIFVLTVIAFMTSGCCFWAGYLIQKPFLRNINVDPEARENLCFNKEEEKIIHRVLEKYSGPYNYSIQRLVKINDTSCVGLFMCEIWARKIGSSNHRMVPLLKFEDKLEMYTENKEEQEKILDEFLDLYGEQLPDDHVKALKYYFTKTTNTHARDYPFFLLIENDMDPRPEWK